MESEEKCPLCGKVVKDGDSLCDDCRNHIDNQYTTNLFENNASQNDDYKEREREEATTVVNIEENSKPVVDTENYNLDNKEVIASQKKKISKNLIFIFVGCILIVVIGLISVIKTSQKIASVENEQAFWDSCVVINTPLAYAKYLVTYQDGIYVNEAHNRIRDLRSKEDSTWMKVKASKDVNDFYNYLNENPNTPYIDAARLKMDTLTWLKVSKDATPDAYLSYIDNVKLGNIKGIYLDQAQQEYDYLSQFKTLEGEALDSLRNQLVALYLALSVYDKDAIEDAFATQVNFYSDTIANTSILDYIAKDLKNRKLNKINLQANKGSVSAIKDGKGNLSVKLLVNKEEINNANKKNYSVDSTTIQINNQKKISCIVANKH